MFGLGVKTTKYKTICRARKVGGIGKVALCCVAAAYFIKTKDGGVVKVGPSSEVELGPAQ